MAVERGGRVSVGINGIGGEIGRAAARRLGDVDGPLTFSPLELMGVNNRTPITTKFIRHEPALLRQYNGYAVNENEFQTPAGVAGASWFQNIKDIPWEVGVVLEGTGAFTKPADLENYISEGKGSYVVLGSPFAKGANPEDYPTIVWGVNDKTFHPDRHNIVSASSCTTTAAALTIQAMGLNGRVLDCSLDTIHAYTPSQNRSYGTHKKGGGMMEDQHGNMIMGNTGAKDALPLIFSGMTVSSAISTRVDVPRGSILTLHLFPKDGDRFQVEAIKESIVENAAYINNRSLGPVLSYATSEELSTIAGMMADETHRVKGTVVLIDKIVAVGDGVKVVTMYNNVDGFVGSWLRLAQEVARQAIDAGTLK